MLRQSLQCVLLVAVLILAVRLALVASSAESGWGLVGVQWQYTAPGFVGLGHEPIGERPPAEQARYWLRETESVLAAHPDSAAMHMGAAWMLDSPSLAFMQKHHDKARESPAGSPSMGLELDETTIAPAKAEFRRQCLARCLELAERATQLEPGDVRWWRMRALLQFEGDIFWSGLEFGPRRDDCLKVLDQCAEHDPDNALYDYLGALLLWEKSASFDMPLDIQDDRWVLTVQDASTFDSATERFLRGQEKNAISIGEEGYSAIAEFVEASRARKSHQANIAASRLVTPRQSILFHDLWRWQNVRAENARSAGDIAAEAAIRRQSLRFFAQAAAPNESSAMNTLVNVGPLRQGIYEEVEKLAREDASLFDPGNLAELRRQEESMRIEAATLEAALIKLDDANHPVKNAALMPGILSTAACNAAAALLGGAAVCLLLARILARGPVEPAGLGFWRQLIAWAIACGGAFFFLGMIPAEMLSEETRHLGVVICLWAAAILAISGITWHAVGYIRSRRIRFRLTTLFAVTTGVALIAAFCHFAAGELGGEAISAPSLWSQAKGWEALDAETVRTSVNVEKGTWSWATFQWFVHGGPYVGVAAAMMLAAAWFMWRCAGASGERILNFWTQRIKTRWAGLLRFAGKSAFFAALCWLLAYLWITPQVVRLGEAEFQHRMRYCRDPLAHIEEIRTAQAIVKSTAGEMNAIQRSIHFDLYGGDVREQDFEEGRD